MSGLFSIKNIDFETLGSSGHPRPVQRPHCAPKFLREHVSAGQALLFIVSPHLHKYSRNFVEVPGLFLCFQRFRGIGVECRSEQELA